MDEALRQYTMAKRAKERLTTNPCEELRLQILDTIQIPYKGIWAEVFAYDFDMNKCICDLKD